MGSGTTAISALNTGRRFVGFELDKKYYDILYNRIAEHTDKRVKKETMAVPIEIFDEIEEESNKVIQQSFLQFA